MKIILHVLLLSSLWLLVACDTKLNSAPPSYVKDITCYKEGSDGIMVYIVLADETGAMTTASGTLKLTILETEHSQPIFSLDLPVQHSLFQRAKVGMGAFEHEVLLLNIGRITYGSFSSPPEEMSTGKLMVELTTEDGRIIKGDNICSL